MLHAGAEGGLEAAYAKAATIPGYRAIREQVPVLATWDDHDYGQNDAGGDFFYKEQAKVLFLDFWDIPADDPRRAREGIYHAAVFGPPGMRVQVILLDTRSFRSLLLPTDQHGAPGKERYLPDPDPRKTMLGAAQWAWLRSQLQQPAEPYGQYEITSSGRNMSYAATRSSDRSGLGAVYGAANFGTVDIELVGGPGHPVGARRERQAGTPNLLRLRAAGALICKGCGADSAVEGGGGGRISIPPPRMAQTSQKPPSPMSSPMSPNSGSSMTPLSSSS